MKKNKCYIKLRQVNLTINNTKPTKTFYTNKDKLKKQTVSIKNLQKLEFDTKNRVFI